MKKLLNLFFSILFLFASYTPAYAHHTVAHSREILSSNALEIAIIIFIFFMSYFTIKLLRNKRKK